MSPTEKVSQKESWQLVGPIASGGTVFGLAVSRHPDVPGYWAATGCGIFYSKDGGTSWQQQLNGLTTPLISALTVAPNGTLYAGSLNADLFVSYDFGRSWQRGTLSYDAEGTVTAMTTSPNYREDGTAFAAMDGGALMVTRDSGKHWEDASFGLNSMTVIAVAVSPDWSRYETMFAATDEGVYISRNGGRAWRPTSLMLDDLVDTLVASPAFVDDQTVYAGTESGSLYISTDGGRNWELFQEQIAAGPINCLWLAPDFGETGKMLVSIGQGIYLSNDRGENWQQVTDTPGTVLSLAGDENVLLAGMHDAGVLKSEDGGQSWTSASGDIAARGFARLIAADSDLYAMGPQEGIYVSGDQGASWQPIEGLAPYLPISDMVVPGEGHLFAASHQAGVLHATIRGGNWRVRSEKQGITTLLVLPEENLGWAGTDQGELLTSRDGGMTWTEMEDPPTAGQAVLSIVASPAFAQDRTLYMGTAIPGTRTRKARVALWRSRNRGRTWHQITTQVTESRWIDIEMPKGVEKEVAEQAVLGIGPFCLRPLRRDKDVWISTTVDPNGANVLKIIAIGEIDNGAVLYAATGNGIYRSNDSGRTWHTFSEGMENQSVVGMVLLQDGDSQTLAAMGLGGLFWKYELS